MDDEFLVEYFKKLSLELDNQEFINELKSSIKRSKKEKIEELIKKYY